MSLASLQDPKVTFALYPPPSMEARQPDHIEDLVCMGSGHSCLVGSESLFDAHFKGQHGGKGVAMPAASGPTPLMWTCLPLAPNCPGPENPVWPWFPCPTLPPIRPALPTSSCPYCLSPAISCHLSGPWLSLLGAADPALTLSHSPWFLAFLSVQTNHPQPFLIFLFCCLVFFV